MLAPKSILSQDLKEKKPHLKGAYIVLLEFSRILNREPLYDINKNKVISYLATQGGFSIPHFNTMSLKFLKNNV